MTYNVFGGTLNATLLVALWFFAPPHGQTPALIGVKFGGVGCHHLKFQPIWCTNVCFWPTKPLTYSSPGITLDTTCSMLYSCVHEFGGTLMISVIL